MKIGFSRATLAALVFAMCSSAALAQDGVSNWQGAYVGAFAEGGLAQFDMHDKDCWYCASGSFTDLSAEFGVQAGYDWQVGNLVYGVSASASTGPSSVNNVWYDDAYFESELANMVALRGRMGFASGANLVYVTGGLLSGKFEGVLAFERDNQGANPTDAAVDDERRAGLAVGVGFSRMISHDVALDVTGEYQAFETGYSNMYDLESESQSIEEIGFGFNRAVLRVGLSHRF